MPDMLRTKVTSCLKPRLLSGSVRCYKCRRAHGALTRELSEGGTEYERTRRPSNGLRGGQGQRPGRAGRSCWVSQGGRPRGRGAGCLWGGQRHCPGRAGRVPRSSLALNSGRAKGVSEGYVFSMGVVETRLCDHPQRRLRTGLDGGGGVSVACLKCGRLIEGAWRFPPGRGPEGISSGNNIFRGSGCPVPLGSYNVSGKSRPRTSASKPAR